MRLTEKEDRMDEGYHQVSTVVASCRTGVPHPSIRRPLVPIGMMVVSGKPCPAIHTPSWILGHCTTKEEVADGRRQEEDQRSLSLTLTLSSLSFVLSQTESEK